MENKLVDELMQRASQMDKTVRSDQRVPDSEATPRIGAHREWHVDPHPSGLYEGVAYINGKRWVKRILSNHSRLRSKPQLLSGVKGLSFTCGHRTTRSSSPKNCVARPPLLSPCDEGHIGEGEAIVRDCGCPGARLTLHRIGMISTPSEILPPASSNCLAVAPVVLR